MAVDKADNRFSRGMAAACLAVCGLVTAALPAAARADTQPAYDRRIEEAAIRMLQPKLGDIRGSLDLDTDGHLSPPLRRRVGEHFEPETLFPQLRGSSQGSIIQY